MTHICVLTFALSWPTFHVSTHCWQNEKRPLCIALSNNNFHLPKSLIKEVEYLNWLVLIIQTSFEATKQFWKLLESQVLLVGLPGTTMFWTFFFFFYSSEATPFARRLLNPWVCYWVNIFNRSEATVRPWQTERLRSQSAALQSSLGTGLSVYFSRSWSPCNQQRIGSKGPLWNRSVAAHILPSPWIWEVRTWVSRRAG